MQEKIMDQAINPAIPNGMEEKYRAFITVNGERYYFEDRMEKCAWNKLKAELRGKGVDVGSIIEREKEPEVSGWKG